MTYKILDLVNPPNSNVGYHKVSFPDGQQDIVITSQEVNVPILIKSRFNSFLDLELIICATKALHGIGCNHISLFSPYVLGARSDRKFQEGGTSYLRDVIAPIINAQNFEKVFVIDPHSDVMEGVINNLHTTTNVNLVKWVFDNGWNSVLMSNSVLVAPDAGAYKKIFKLAKDIGFLGKIVTCSKFRNTEGKIIGTDVPLTEDMICKDFVIIDDICDGGATFMGIAEAINAYRSQYKCLYGKIRLVVTHGIFSKGFVDLKKCIDNIYCTDSVKSIEPHGYTPREEKGSDIVNQFSVFK